MKAFIIGLIIGILLVPALFYYYVKSGKAPVATSDPPMPLEEFFAKTALHTRVRAQYPKQVPIQPDENVYMGGAHVYRDNCAMCHGLPTQLETSPAKGMFPHPPQFFEGHEMVTDDPPGVTYWKAENGIRLSGMPGFHASLNNQQLWAVSLLLANVDKLPASVMHTLSAPLPADAIPPQAK